MSELRKAAQAVVDHYVELGGGYIDALRDALAQPDRPHLPNGDTGVRPHTGAESCTVCGEDWPCPDAQPDDERCPDPLRKAARETAEWLTDLQRIYHSVTQNFPMANVDTCDAGMCGDYRHHRDALRDALAQPDRPDPEKLARALPAGFPGLWPEAAAKCAAAIVAAWPED